MEFTNIVADPIGDMLKRMALLASTAALALLIACNSVPPDSGNTAAAATIHRQEAEITRLKRELDEQRAQLNAIRSAREMQDNVAATRRAIAIRDTATKREANQ